MLNNLLYEVATHIKHFCRGGEGDVAPRIK